MGPRETCDDKERLLPLLRCLKTLDGLRGDSTVGVGVVLDIGGLKSGSPGKLVHSSRGRRLVLKHGLLAS